jgi:hypothetical protein
MFLAKERFVVSAYVLHFACELFAMLGIAVYDFYEAQGPFTCNVSIGRVTYLKAHAIKVP